MNNKKITMTYRENYGAPAYYPACELSTLLCDIARKKTLTAEMREILKTAGFQIEIIGATAPR